MKKIISILMVIFLIFGVTIPHAGASTIIPINKLSNENNDEKQLQNDIDTEIKEAEKEIRKEIEKEITNLYGKETLEDIESLDLGIEILKNGQIIVTLNLNTTDFEAGFELDMYPESDTIILTSTFIDEKGEEIHKKLAAVVHENNDDVFKASLQDIETGEVYNIDTTELNASVLPVFVYVVGGVAIRTTARYVLGIPIKNLSHRGFNSFDSLRKFLGNAGVNRQWHHIVEQSQIAKSGFSKTSIHNTRNIVSIDIQHHQRITGYYNSIQPHTQGKRVRDWLAGKSWDYQYDYGIKIMDRLR